MERAPGMMLLATTMCLQSTHETLQQRHCAWKGEAFQLLAGNGDIRHRG